MFFFFIDPSTTVIYTLSLHDALPIYPAGARLCSGGAGVGKTDRERGGGRIDRHVSACGRALPAGSPAQQGTDHAEGRSEEHTSELQSRRDLVCRLLLEKKKNKKN